MISFHSQEDLLRLLQLEGIHHPAVLQAMAAIDRRNFVDVDYQAHAYEDRPLPIARQQTISQPFIVARMTSLLLDSDSHLGKVMEIGTGSGYQAAVLAQLAKQVFTIERIESLYFLAKQRLGKFMNVKVLWRDGAEGLPEQAPFDAIIVTAFCKHISKAWQEQLAEGGRIILPLEKHGQQYLVRVTRHGKQFNYEEFEPVAFVPLLEGLDQT